MGITWVSPWCKPSLDEFGRNRFTVQSKFEKNVLINQCENHQLEVKIRSRESLIVLMKKHVYFGASRVSLPMSNQNKMLHFFVFKVCDVPLPVMLIKTSMKKEVLHWLNVITYLLLEKKIISHFQKINLKKLIFLNFIPC